MCDALSPSAEATVFAAPPLAVSRSGGADSFPLVGLLKRSRLSNRLGGWLSLFVFLGISKIFSTAIGGPGGIRTRYPLLRRQLLCPNELQARWLSGFLIFFWQFQVVHYAVSLHKTPHIIPSSSFFGQSTPPPKTRQMLPANEGCLQRQSHIP